MMISVVLHYKTSHMGQFFKNSFFVIVLERPFKSFPLVHRSRKLTNAPLSYGHLKESVSTFNEKSEIEKSACKV